jgi:hypothetical protein
MNHHGFEIEVDWMSGDRFIRFDNGVCALLASDSFYALMGCLAGSMDRDEERQAMRSWAMRERQRLGLHPRIPMTDLRRAVGVFGQ